MQSDLLARLAVSNAAMAISAAMPSTTANGSTVTVLAIALASLFNPEDCASIEIAGRGWSSIRLMCGGGKSTRHEKESDK